MLNKYGIETPKGRRLPPEEERALAQRILDAQERAREAIRAIPAARKIVDKKPKRKERTRAGEVDRLHKAVEAAKKAVLEDPSIREDVRKAVAAMQEAEDLTWQLAATGTDVARGEARKLGRPTAMADLLQEGFIGLYQAAKRFDPSRDIRFSTYARWWVRAEMTRSIDRGGRPIRLPGAVVEQLRNLHRAMARYEQAGIEYSIADVAEEVGLDEDRAQRLLGMGQVESLDAPSGDADRSLGELIPDEAAQTPDEEAIRIQEVTRMREAIEKLLDVRRRRILRRRWGLDDLERRTLEEVGKSMNLSRERVRQLEREAMAQLRSEGNIRESLFS